MEFKTTFWAVIAFSTIIIAAGALIQENGIAYGSSIRSDLGEDFNKLDDMSNVAGNISGQISPESGEASSDYESLTFRSGYGILGKMKTYLSSIYSIIINAQDRYSIPSFVSIAAFAALGVAIILGIVAIIFRLGRVSA